MVKNLFFDCLLVLKSRSIITGRDTDISKNLVIARLILYGIRAIPIKIVPAANNFHSIVLFSNITKPPLIHILHKKVWVDSVLNGGMDNSLSCLYPYDNKN